MYLKPTFLPPFPSIALYLSIALSKVKLKHRFLATQPIFEAPIPRITASLPPKMSKAWA
uniref:Uncharacterized protein n=1 Tax=Helianthus annuus TaxID=4232 RepID=A0A251UCL2_HELAN